MRELYQSGAFKRDYKLMQKRGYALEKIEVVIHLLVHDEPLPDRCRPHKLKGNYGGFWECHIEPDWLLIYDVGDDFLDLARTGTHADLFS